MLNNNALIAGCLKLFILFATVTTSVLADNTENNTESLTQLVISNAYMPKIPPVSRTAAIYLSIENQSNQSIAITDAVVTFARHSMFHQTVEENGVAKMKHLDKIVVPAGKTVELKPGGAHIMLMGLDDIPDEGQFDLLLHSGELSKTVVVTVGAN